jgi:micrococcal nuclease
MYEYKCRIIKVVDGDTVDVDIDLGFGVWLNNKRVRLYGIDTPECRTRDREEKYFGFMAKALVKDFLPEGSTQRLSTLLSKSRKGKFGRILGEFWVYDSWTDSQTTINKALLIRNYAVKYDGQSKKEIEDSHKLNREIICKRLGYEKDFFKSKYSAEKVSEADCSFENYKKQREDIILQPATKRKGN